VSVVICLPIRAFFDVFVRLYDPFGGYSRLDQTKMHCNNIK